MCPRKAKTAGPTKASSGVLSSYAAELELELIQTHMTQKPMLRVEVGAFDARQAKKGGSRAVTNRTPIELAALRPVGEDHDHERRRPARFKR